MFEEEIYRDEGIAYTSENFDDENYFNDWGGEGINCECIWDECPISHLPKEQFERYCVLREQCEAGEL